MPPEAIGDENTPLQAPMQASSDVYALGIVAHQLLTGSLLPVACGKVRAVELPCHSYCSWWYGGAGKYGSVR